MDSNRKAELKRAYKETVPRKGVFKVHCSATGQTWIDASPNVDRIKNRIWFTLDMGNHPSRGLQEAWNAAGAAAMQFEIVEVFPPDASGYALERLMKERKQHWLEALEAEPYQ